MRITPLLAASAVALLPSSVSAWGFLGHKTVALLASRYFLPETAIFVREHLYKDQTIMDAATWADRFAHIPIGRFSKTWHYIDARDSPPEYCQVNYVRDCESSGCIVRAIMNMTERVTNEDLTWYHRSQALKWVLHFLGDIHQPLHTEHKLRGGNSIKVLFKGHDANLHSVWDGRIIGEVYGNPGTDRQVIAFANELERRLEEGDYDAASRDQWASCLNITNSEHCSVQWAQSANDYICSYVLKDDPEGKELSGEYATGAVPIIEKSIATAAWRLAGWMNMIVAGRDGLGEEDRKAMRVGRVAWSGEGVLRGVRDLDQMSDEEKEERRMLEEAERGREGLVVQDMHVH